MHTSTGDEEARVSKGEVRLQTVPALLVVATACIASQIIEHFPCFTKKGRIIQPVDITPALSRKIEMSPPDIFLELNLAWSVALDMASPDDSQQAVYFTPTLIFEIDLLRHQLRRHWHLSQ
jgi:hypothetical protein